MVVSTRSSGAANPAAVAAAAAATVSPYFASTPSFSRKSRRKAAVAAAAIMTASRSAVAVAVVAASAPTAAALIPSTPHRCVVVTPPPLPTGTLTVAAAVSNDNSSSFSTSRTTTTTTTTTTGTRIKRKTLTTAVASVTPSPSSKKPRKLTKQTKPHKTTITTTTTTTSPTAPATKKKKAAPVTNSFEPMWSKQFVTATSRNEVPVHTLILGTHPSITSLSQEQYYGHAMNAFWWIAGDCLGFRRAQGTKVNGEPYKFASDLRYPCSNIIPYKEQLKTMAMKGFAMWDIVASCQRPGSLDQDIRNETPNNIQEFCQQHPSLKRIVFANGGTGATIFVKHFKAWLASGELEALPNHEPSQVAFGKAIQKGEQQRQKQKQQDNDQEDTNVKNKTITLISALSVSPAAARYPYAEKRHFWDKYVYQPGIADFERNQQNAM